MSVRTGTMVNTDGSWSVRNVTGVVADDQVVAGELDTCARWLSWVHQCISHTKAWITSTGDVSIVQCPEGFSSLTK